MRIYFDSNIFRKIRKDSRQFDLGLHAVVEHLRSAFVFLFSDAHLSDLSGSQAGYREIDLLHMGEYVGQNYLSFDHVHKQLHIYLATPLQAYGNKDFVTFDKVLQDPLGYLEAFFDQPETSMFKPLIRSIFDGPLVSGLQDNPELLKLIGTQAASGLQEVSTIREALARTGPLSDLLNSKNEFFKYQDLVRGMVPREEYSFDAWSFEFDERMRDTAFGKSFSELVEVMNSAGDKKDTFNRFVNYYCMLETVGVTQERAGGKRKKNSYMDIYRDAQHAYFASNADYFVSDDKGVLTKAFIAYKMLEVKTEVLSSAELMVKSRSLLLNEDNLDSFLQGLDFSLESGFVLHSNLPGDQQVIKLPYRVMNYFNRLQLERSQDGTYLLLFRTGDDEKGVMYSEMDLLLDKCVRLFGLPADGRQRLDIGDYEQASEEVKTREWQLGRCRIFLGFGTSNHGKQVIYLQICL